MAGRAGGRAVCGAVIGRAGAMAAAAMVAAAGGGDFSDLREIKKQLLSVAERSRERGLQHSGKW